MISTIPSQKSHIIDVTTEIGFIKMPVSVYKKTFHNLIYGEIANLIINTKGKNGQCYWVFSAFTKNKDNEVDTVFSEILIDCEKLDKINTLYQKLNKIEKNASVKVAEKYLNGYLEYYSVSLNDLVSYYSLTA